MSPLVKRFLEERGVAFATIGHRPLISFEDAREILPQRTADMVKGLVFRGPGNGLAIVALCAADRADYKRIADALGMRRADLRLADPAEVRERLDMEAGGVVPLPINGARVLADRAATVLDEIVCGTGRNTATLVIAREAWLAVAGAEVGDFSKQA
jgi:Cys-tRNA(Pro)/Cys-tRNA(Cys) deacylase